MNPVTPRNTALLLALLTLAGCASDGNRAQIDTPAALETPPTTLLRCTLLVPLRYNDGTTVPEVELRRIEDRLFDRFGGYTIAGRVRGAYRMADGTRAEDESLVVWVAVLPARVAELREEAARIAADLKQESVYFEHGDGRAGFARAAGS